MLGARSLFFRSRIGANSQVGQRSVVQQCDFPDNTVIGDRKIMLDVDATARDWLAAKGWDPAYGARPLKRVIQRHVQDPLAEMILSGSVHDGEKVQVAAAYDGLTFNGKVAQAA